MLDAVGVTTSLWGHQFSDSKMTPADGIAASSMSSI